MIRIQDINKKLHGTAVDSLLLTFVKVITSVFGLLVTKIISTQFTLQQYGTYSQGMLIVSTATSITILGLTDATNYFYNAREDEKKKKNNVCTIFGMQYCLGIFAAVVIMLLSIPIIKYFDNAQLKGVIYVVAWMPLTQNLLSMLQVLFVSIGKAKILAVRNFLLSIARLVITFIGCIIANDVFSIFVMLLLLDIVQIVYFYTYFSKTEFYINLKCLKTELVPDILKFCIPMAIYVMTNALVRDIDKYVIGYFGDTETLAIYTNAAKILPFDLLTASFLTVLIPIVTRQIRSARYKEAQNTFRAYLRVGYLMTWMFVSGAMIVAKELMKFLYDEKYLLGLPVFVIYLGVDMTRFANMSLILTAKGKTKILMYCSIISLLANGIFNVITFKIWGITGPALTTLIITIFLTVALISLDAREIETEVWKLFDWKEIGIMLVEMIVFGMLTYFLKNILYSISNNYVIVLILDYGIYLGIICLLNYKRLINCLREINRLR